MKRPDQLCPDSKPGDETTAVSRRVSLRLCSGGSNPSLLVHNFCVTAICLPGCQAAYPGMEDDGYPVIGRQCPAVRHAGTLLFATDE